MRRRRGRPDIENQLVFEASDLYPSGSQRTLTQLWKKRKLIAGAASAVSAYGAKQVVEHFKKHVSWARPNKNKRAKKDILGQRGKNQVTSNTKAPNMPYRRKRRGRVQRKRKRRTRSRYGRKKRFKRKPLWKSNAQRLLNLAPKKVHQKMSAYKYEEENATGKDIIIHGGTYRDFSSYDDLLSAIDDDGNTFGNTELAAMKQYNTAASIQSTIINWRNQDVYVTPVKYWMKRDLRDSDYDADADDTEAASTIMEIIQQGLGSLMPTANDGKVILNAADTTNDRHEAFLEMPADSKKFSALFLSIFGIKVGRKVLLEPGKEAHARISSKKVKRIYPHLMVSKAGNHTPTLHRGHTEGIIWICHSPMVTSSETDAGAEEDEKASTGMIQVGVDIVRRMTYKALQKDTAAYAFTDDRAAIAPADEQAMVDNAMEVENPVVA